MPSNAGLLMNLIGSFVGDRNLQEGANSDYYVDPNTGQPVGTPYKKPGWGTSFFHPDVAAQEASENQRVSNAWNDAKLQGGSTLARGSTLVAPLQNQFPGQTPLQLAAANSAYGGQGGLNQAIQDYSTRSTGAPSIVGRNLGETAKTASKTGLEEALFSEVQQPTKHETQAFNDESANQLAHFNYSQQPTLQATQKTLDDTALTRASGENARLSTTEQTLTSDAVNRLSASLNLDPLKVTALKNELEGELKRNLTFQEFQDTLLHIKSQNAKVESALADSTAANIPLVTGANVNDLIAKRYTSGYVPSGITPYSQRINPDQTITSGVKTPGYAGPAKGEYGALMNGDLFKTPTGKTAVQGIRLPGGQPLPMVQPDTSVNPDGTPVSNNKVGNIIKLKADLERMIKSATPEEREALMKQLNTK